MPESIFPLVVFGFGITRASIEYGDSLGPIQTRFPCLNAKKADGIGGGFFEWYGACILLHTTNERPSSILNFNEEPF